MGGLMPDEASELAAELACKQKAAGARPSTAAQLEELDRRERAVQVEVDAMLDLRETLRELHSEASAKHDEALTADLEELEKKTHNLELYGLTMMQLKTEVSALRNKSSSAVNAVPRAD